MGFYLTLSSKFTRYANLDGSDRHTVLEEGSVPHIFSITLFEEWMYWTDWNLKTIEKANRFTGVCIVGKITGSQVCIYC